MAGNTTQGKTKLPCDDCGKELRTKKTLESHMKTFHDGVQGIKNLFLTPTRVATQPKKLFQGEAEPSVQGNSKGQVNSPIVISEGMFKCDECEKEFPRKKECTEHKQKDHKQGCEISEGEDIVMYELAEDAEDALIANELEKMARQYGYTGPCHECNSSKEVNTYQVSVIRKLESKLESMQRRQTKTDEKKNELFKEKTKTLTENAKLKNDLKACQDRLAVMTEKSNKPEVAEVDQRCRQCKFTCRESKNMESHIASVHSLHACHICNEVFTNKAAMRNHVNKHLKNELEYTCRVCKKVFKSIEEAKDHAIKACGSIYVKDAVEVSKKPENPQEKHETYDCDKCKTNFKSQEDVYSHANKCDKIIGPFMCDNCNRELISKAGLTKHIEKCHGDKPSQSEHGKNGPNCRFLKAKRCLFRHDQRQEEPWTLIQQKRQRRQVQAPSQHKKFQQQHRQAKHQQQRQSAQQKSVCRNGPGCIFLKHNRCNFKHIENRQEARTTADKQSRSSAPHRSGLQSTLRQCKFGNKCDKGSNCSFLHLPSDFLPKQGGRRN